MSMLSKFETVKDYLMDLDMKIVREDEDEEIVVVESPENGIHNLVLEQLIMDVPDKPGDLFKRLLQMNRTLVHGAFVLDEAAKRIIFRDTLQLENLDLNELEGSIHALSLAMAEYGGELLAFFHG